MRPIEYITCNECGHRDYKERFPSVHGESHEKYYRLMKEYGHEAEITKGAGFICPECGNYKYFTFNS